MVELRDPTNWSWAVWLLAITMSIAGGFINWYSRIKKGNIKVFNLVELLGEIFTSGFVGIGVFMALEAMNQPLGICAALAGIGGHMATRLLFTIERVVEAKIDSVANK